MQVSCDDAVNTQQQANNWKTERVRGIQSGELFVRLNGPELCGPQGTLRGAKPFLQKLLHLQDDEAAAVQRLVQPSEAKLTFSRNLRRQLRQRRCSVQKRWDAVRQAAEVYDSGSLGAMANHFSSEAPPAARALERYLQHIQRLEQAYKQYATSNILHISALLEAESHYITAWGKREEAKCRDQRALTKLLYQFNSFALQLESETSGQVRLWRLPPTDAQRMRCVKAATENIKKRFFSSPSSSLEVLEVYKVENRVLLNNFQKFTSSLAQTTADIKIKGLFCSVPAESVERCVVYGMHHVPNGESGETRFSDLHGGEVKIFNRSMLLQGHEDAPGTNMAFRARSKATNATPLRFPRRFSRYSTLEEMFTSMTAPTTLLEDESPPIQYLGLCRVAMGKTLRAKDPTSALFPEDPSIGTLLYPDEEEYLVRYPDAVVPEFIIQFRVVTPPAPLSVDFSKDSIIPVSLGCSVPSLASNAFQDFIYSAAFDTSASAISAFPLALPASDRQRSCFASNGPPTSSSPTFPASHQQNEDALSKKAGDQQQVSPETVLANCARQKALLREDLQRLESLFWSRAREVWEEEGIRSGINPQRDDQLHSPHKNVEARTRQLRGELDMLNQLQDVMPEPAPKVRHQHLKTPPPNVHRR
ncbi:hypothetical protein PRIC2_007898 [Phytophthora ramorum]